MFYFVFHLILCLKFFFNLKNLKKNKLLVNDEGVDVDEEKFINSSSESGIQIQTQLHLFLLISLKNLKSK